MGIIIMVLYSSKYVSTFDIPFWVIISCHIAIALGTVFGGWRIVKTMGMRITKLEPHQGFAAEMAAATTITIASRLGIPLSTTHTISTAIIGVGAARGLSAVRWGVTVELVSAWILTFPICAIISWLVVKLVRALS